MHWQSGTYTRSRDLSGLKEARASPPPIGREDAQSWGRVVALGRTRCPGSCQSTPSFFFFFFPTLPRDPATGTRAEISNLVMIRVVRVYVGMCVRGAAPATLRPPPRWADADKQQTTPALQYSLHLFSCPSSE